MERPIDMYYASDELEFLFLCIEGVEGGSWMENGRQMSIPRAGS